MWEHRHGPPWWSEVIGRGRRGWLRPIILSLLASRPMNGVEIMDSIEAMTGGMWRPSPGSVYPMLSELLDEGLVRRRDDGRYELTDRGLELARTLYAPALMAVDVVNVLERSIAMIEAEASTHRESLAKELARLRELRDRLDRVIRELEGTGH